MPRRFITENYKINNNMIEIFDEAKHIQVTRNKIGDTIEINEYICKIVSIDKSSITCEIIGNAEKVGIPKTNITLYQALLKADKMEYVIQKSVELGVSKIVPFISKNVVVKVDEKDANKKVDRWNKIAIEAVKQCGRSDMVGVENVEKFSEMLNSLLSFDRVILAYENEKEPLKRVLREINSNEKIAIFFFVDLAAAAAIFNAKAVLPTAGRAAIIINCVSCKPSVTLSKSLKPVVKPVILPLFFTSISISSCVLTRTSCIFLNSVVLLVFPTSKISFSANSTASETSTLSSYAAFSIFVAVSINLLKVYFSVTASI